MDCLAFTCNNLEGSGMKLSGTRDSQVEIDDCSFVLRECRTASFEILPMISWYDLLKN